MRLMWGGPEEPPPLPHPPGLFKKAANLGEALIQHAMNGFENVPDEVRKIRLEICEACEEFTEQRSCNACGCYMDIKARWSAMKCPKNKWTAYQKDTQSNCGCSTSSKTSGQ